MILNDIDPSDMYDTERDTEFDVPNTPEDIPAPTENDYVHFNGIQAFFDHLDNIKKKELV